jgi:hypothetical protein
MTRAFLIAGVAALAIAAPASAKPGGAHGGGGGGNAAMIQHGGGGGGQARAVNYRGGGGGGFAAPRVQRQSFAAPRMQRQSFAAFERPQRAQRMTAIERPQRQARVERQQLRTNRVQVQNRMAERQQLRANRAQPQRMAQRQQLRANRIQPQNRIAERQQLRGNRIDQVQNRMVERQQLRANRIDQRQDLRAGRMAGINQGAGYGVGGCPPGLASKGCMPPGLARQEGLITGRQTLRADRIANAEAFRASRFAALTAFSPRTRVIAPVEAVRFVGQPLSAVTPFMALSPLPGSVSYLYPDTPDYYYQYGGGYLYQVDRGSNLIAALLPLLAGGFMPGTYLPSTYMNSYAPDYWGLNSFYPSSYGYDSGYGYGSAYGYGYNNLCNRYADGVIYEVDCATGLIEDVVPVYAGGYGVGQMLPSAYNYYNVPMQYRSMYYNTADAGYWYAPGAIYQYDPGSSMITSVAALMSPGFSIGQPLPMGYGAYNVPYAYRATYYDTPNAWYRYNNGYIYQVDPTTQLVTAIVASLLT